MREREREREGERERERERERGKERERERVSIHRPLVLWYLYIRGCIYIRHEVFCTENTGWGECSIITALRHCMRPSIVKNVCRLDPGLAAVEFLQCCGYCSLATRLFASLIFLVFWVISLQKDGEEAVVVGNRDTLTLISSLLQVSIKGCED